MLWPFEFKYVWCCLGGQQHSIFTCANFKVMIREYIYGKNLMWIYQVENHATNYAKHSPMPTLISCHWNIYECSHEMNDILHY
jgi:hypothetical protein